MSPKKLEGVPDAIREGGFLGLKNLTNGLPRFDGRYLMIDFEYAKLPCILVGSNYVLS